jgi:hypothetical protein
MTLKEKFEEVFIENWLSDYAIECEKIADDYAIEFAHWCEWQDGKAFETFQELLEIYKKEKGL